jgi:2-oxoglutarate ferredoxin oxidoreductase subunit alpha
MLEDVRLAVEGRCPVEFYGRMGGVMPLPDEILEVMHRVALAYRPVADGIESRFM